MSEKDYDPRMHTVEHILNGAIASRLKCDRAFSTHIERKKSKIDFRFNRNLTAEEVVGIEKYVNKVIEEGVDVVTEFINVQEAKQKYNLSRLPQDAGDDIRIVRIGSYDVCPCIGEHLSNTYLVDGTLKIISNDFNDETGVLRVRFKINSK